MIASLSLLTVSRRFWIHARDMISKELSGQQAKPFRHYAGLEHRRGQWVIFSGMANNASGGAVFCSKVLNLRYHHKMKQG